MKYNRFLSLLHASTTPSPVSSRSLPPAPPPNANCPMPSLTAQQFAGLKLDFVIIGSGAGGLPLAARLSENPNVQVGLIEAGVFHPDDPLINIPGNVGLDVGNATYDWLFASVPQENASGRVIQETRGKMLGGSTGINFLGWDRASAAEYNAWSTFSPPTTSTLTAWTHAALLPYFKKTENVNLDFFDTFPGVTAAEYAVAKQQFQQFDGFSGPISASYNSVYGDLISPYVKSWNALGVPTNPNIYGGNTAGVRNERISVNTGVRSYTASAYYCPAASRKNFHVLTGAQATHVTFNNKSTSPNALLKATGVSFVDVSGSGGNTTFTVKASKEVILSAGSVQTPQLLELSGIGDKNILGPLGIQTLVNLPGVGANLQDHIFVPTQFVALNNITTFDILRYNQTFFQEQMEIYQHNHTGFLTATDSALVWLPSNATAWPQNEITSLISSLSNVIQTQQASLTPLQKKQYQTQLSWLTGSNVPQAEFILSSAGLVNPANNTNYLAMLAGLMHPLSRGTIHINSQDPLAHPTIDPKYLSFDFDLQSLRISTQLMLTVAGQAPISNLLTGRDLPAANVVNNTDFEDYVRETVLTGDHLSGTAAMASQALGGVVDTSLKVYGTSNLRVVDASIIPLQIGAHLQGTIYAISEKAADIIKAANGL